MTARPTEQEAARARVLDALVTIQLFDTDHEFIRTARRRYLAIAAVPTTPVQRAEDSPTAPKEPRL